MTYQQLADEICAMTPAQKSQPVLVWPPEACPASSRVSVKALRMTATGPVLSTGKEVTPEVPAPSPVPVPPT